MTFTPTRASYLEAELFAVAPLPCHEGLNGQFCMQIRSEKGATKWLNITARQFKAIENVLLEELDNVNS